MWSTGNIQALPWTSSATAYFTSSRTQRMFSRQALLSNIVSTPPPHSISKILGGSSQLLIRGNPLCLPLTTQLCRCQIPFSLQLINIHEDVADTTLVKVSLVRMYLYTHLCLSDTLTFVSPLVRNSEKKAYQIMFCGFAGLSPVQVNNFVAVHYSVRCTYRLYSLAYPHPHLHTLTSINNRIKTNKRIHTHHQ